MDKSVYAYDDDWIEFVHHHITGEHLSKKDLDSVVARCFQVAPMQWHRDDV